jgi:hypothetical protein
MHIYMHMHIYNSTHYIVVIYIDRHCTVSWSIPLGFAHLFARTRTCARACACVRAYPLALLVVTVALMVSNTN